MLAKKLKIVVALFFFVFLFIVISIFNYQENHDRVKIITGPTTGSFYKLALDYQKILVDRGFKVDIEPVPNTSELAQRVNNSKNTNTISFMIGLNDISSLPNVRSLGIIGKQPLFIFYNKKNGQMTSLSILKGKKILLLPKTSATTILSLEILNLYGVNEKNSTIEYHPLSEMYNRISSGDYYAGFAQLTAENPLVSQLALEKDLNIYSYDNMGAILNKLFFLDPSQLSPGSFDILKNIPPQPINLLAGNIEIIVSKNINKSVVYDLLENFESLHKHRTLVSQAGEFPKYSGTQAELHEVIQEYKKSGTPWYYKNFRSLFAMIIDNYSIYFLIIFILIEFYKKIGYFHDFIYLFIEYISLAIIEKNHGKIKSGQLLGSFSQIVQRWAVGVIERKTIRQKAVKMIIDLQNRP